MGNAGANCADAGFTCTEQCKRIYRHDAFLAETPFGGCDPAGAVFEETLQELSDLDRQLIRFASSSNVIAVRWLLEIKASLEAHDTNGTTCLHAACRGGSQLVVVSLLEKRRKAGQEVSTLHAVDETRRRFEREASTLNAMDASGWTPLHISVFMGRPEVCAHLLESRASLDKRNFVGQIPLDLCNDARTRAVLLDSKGAVSRVAAQRRIDEIGQKGDMVEGLQMHSLRRQAPQSGTDPDTQAAQVLPPENWCEVHFEPFFVPRPPVIRDPLTTNGSKAELKKIGRAIFKRQPGRGLAFLVATGCTRDYPIDMVALLRGNSFDLSMIGTFLGEDFSLSKILRMEFINSISMARTGIVQSLNKTFANFSAPYDLRKVDRILTSLAEVWWRQHMREPPSFGGAAPPGAESDKTKLMPMTVSRLGPHATKPSMPQQPAHDAAECPLPDKEEESSDEICEGELPSSTLDQDIEASDSNIEEPSKSFDGDFEAPAEQLHEEVGHVKGPPPTQKVPRAMSPVREVGGFELRRLLSGPGLLHQIMFSAMMLYWNQHHGNCDAPMSLERWLELNSCLDLCRSSAAHILTPIYMLICRAPLPNLKMLKTGGQADTPFRTSALQDHAQVEGWARILGDAMPLIGPSARTRGTAMDVWQVFSEATASTRAHPDLERHPRIGIGSSTPMSIGSSRVLPFPRSSVSVRKREAPSSDEKSTGSLDTLWLSLCSYFLFLSLSQSDGVPFAFIPLAKVHFASIEPAHGTFALDGGPDLVSSPNDTPDVRPVEEPLPQNANGQADSGTGREAARLPLVLVFLLPDGRWQTYEVPRLVLQVTDKKQLEAWVLRLSELASMGPEDLAP